jgi:hypothetical protein
MALFSPCKDIQLYKKPLGSIALKKKIKVQFELKSK